MYHLPPVNGEWIEFAMVKAMVNFCPSCHGTVHSSTPCNKLHPALCPLLPAYSIF